MKIHIKDSEVLGEIVKASRKAQGLRQDDAAGSIGVSENFLGKIERGSNSVQWGKLFQVLQGLGIHVYIDIEESVAAKTGLICDVELVKARKYICISTECVNCNLNSKRSKCESSTKNKK